MGGKTERNLFRRIFGNSKREQQIWDQSPHGMGEQPDRENVPGERIVDTPYLGTNEELAKELSTGRTGVIADNLQKQGKEVAVVLSPRKAKILTARNLAIIGTVGAGLAAGGVIYYLKNRPQNK